MKADNLVICFLSFLVISLLMNVFSTDSVADVCCPMHEGDITSNRDSGHLEIIKKRSTKELGHIMTTTPGATHPTGGLESTPPAYTENLPYTSKKPEKDKKLSNEILRLSLRDFIQLVKEKNEQIRFQDLEWAISREGVKSAEAVFEPEFVGAYQLEDSNQRTTVKERVELQNLPEFGERSNDYAAALEVLGPTGGRWRLGYNLRAFRNTLDEIVGVEREYKTFLGGSITQPLLKGGGEKAIMAGIWVAEADADMTFQRYREEMIRIVSEAIAAYWDLYSAQEKYKMRKESARLAEILLRNNLVRVKTGKMAETEVLEAKAGLALRKSLVSEAKQGIVFAMNNVRTLFSFSAAEKDIEIEAADRAEIEALEPDFLDSLPRAFKLRPEYISSRRKLEREDIKVVFAKNQTWPQLDLKGSYGLNGLSDSLGGSWEDTLDTDTKTWFIGVELRIPLTGGKKSRSELRASKKRKEQALVELKAVEVAMANAVDTAIRSVHSTREQVTLYTSVVDFNRRLLEAEIATFKAGKSNTRLLLEKEGKLIIAKERELDSLVKYKRAILELEIGEGSVLLNQGIEIMDVDL